MAPGFLAIPTPGHTKGHCVLLFQDRFLFMCDHLDWDRDAQQLSASEDYCWYSWPHQAESMMRLGDYLFEWVLPGHGQKVHLPAAEMRREILRLAKSIQGPQRVSRKEIEDAFAGGWVIEPSRFDARPDVKDFTFSEGGPKAWFVVVRRAG